MFSDQSEMSMGVLPVDWMTIIGVFTPLFTAPVWRHVPVRLGGAIWAPGKRTVTAVWRVMGFGHDRRFHRSPRVLRHARGSVLAASRLLLGELLAALAPVGPVVMGLDDDQPVLPGSLTSRQDRNRESALK